MEPSTYFIQGALQWGWGWQLWFSVYYTTTGFARAGSPASLSALTAEGDGNCADPDPRYSANMCFKGTLVISFLPLQQIIACCRRVRTEVRVVFANRLRVSKRCARRVFSSRVANNIQKQT